MKGVTLVYQRNNGQLCAALEEVDDISPAAMLKCWCVSNGMSEAADKSFRMDHAPIITADELAKFLP
jgi:hypothetical protein